MFCTRSSASRSSPPPPQRRQCSNSNVSMHVGDTDLKKQLLELGGDKPVIASSTSSLSSCSPKGSVFSTESSSSMWSRVVLPPLQVVNISGRWFSLDDNLLLMYKTLKKNRLVTNVPITIVALDAVPPGIQAMMAQRAENNQQEQLLPHHQTHRQQRQRQAAESDEEFEDGDSQSSSSSSENGSKSEQEKLASSRNSSEDEVCEISCNGSQSSPEKSNKSRADVVNKPSKPLLSPNKTIATSNGSDDKIKTKPGHQAKQQQNRQHRHHHNRARNKKSNSSNNTGAGQNNQQISVSLSKQRRNNNDDDDSGDGDVSSTND